MSKRGAVVRESETQEPSFQIRPSFDKKFRPGEVKEAIQTSLNHILSGRTYNPDKVPDWCKDISNSIKNKIKVMGYDRYKIVVEVVIGEQRGEGVRMGTRCLWDSDTDNYASDVFMNDSMFCCAAAFGIYYY